MKISSNYVLAKNMDRIKRLYQARLDRKAASQARGKAAGKRSARPALRSQSQSWRVSGFIAWGGSSRLSWTGVLRQDRALRAGSLWN
jgi:hypothetical protein